MATRIINSASRIYEFVSSKTPVPLYAGIKGVGVEKDGRMVAGVLYEGYTGSNLWMHVGAEPGGTWLSRDFLRCVFAYPFEQLGCKRVSGAVEASNLAARRFDEHLGFRQEAVLEGAAHDGGDVILYVMWKKDCRYVHPQ